MHTVCGDFHVNCKLPYLVVGYLVPLVLNVLMSILHVIFV